METTSVERLLKQIWPTIYRAINGSLYFVLNLMKSTVRSMIEELKF